MRRPGRGPPPAHDSSRATFGSETRSRLAPQRRSAVRRGHRSTEVSGNIEGPDIRSAVKRQPIEKERLVSVHGPVRTEEPGPGPEKIAVG